MKFETEGVIFDDVLAAIEDMKCTVCICPGCACEKEYASGVLDDLADKMGKLEKHKVTLWEA